MTKPLYFYNGSTFELIGPTTPQSPIAYQTSAPTGPATGDLWIDSDGDVDTYNRQLTRYYFIATAAQTTISGVDANSLTLAYVAGSEAVYVNGALQVRGQDYTATNGTSVVMSSGLAVNDVVEIFAYTAFTVANAYTKSETDSLVGAAAGLKLLTPTSVAVGSGSGSVTSTGTVTFSGSSSVSLNGCFSGTYDAYRIVLAINANTGGDLKLRLRVAGTDLSGSVYAYHYTMSGNSSQTGYDYIRSAGYTTSLTFGTLAVSSDTLVTFDTLNPFLTKSTSVLAQGNNVGGTDVQIIYGGGRVNNTTSYDGFTFFNSGGGTFTGTISVYGYKD